MTKFVYFSGKMTMTAVLVGSGFQTEHAPHCICPRSPLPMSWKTEMRTSRKCKGRADDGPEKSQADMDQLVLWGWKFWKNVLQAIHRSLEEFQLMVYCRN